MRLETLLALSVTCVATDCTVKNYEHTPGLCCDHIGQVQLYGSEWRLVTYCQDLGECVTYRRVLDWMIGFTDTLYSPLESAGNYSAIADLHTLQLPSHTHQGSQSSLVVPWQQIYNSPTITSNHTRSLLFTVQLLSCHYSATDNCEDSTQFNSSAPKLISWQAGISKLDSVLLYWSLPHNHFAGTTEKTDPLCCWEGVITAPLHRNGSYSIVACVFVAAEMCFPSCCLVSLSRLSGVMWHCVNISKLETTHNTLVDFVAQTRAMCKELPPEAISACQSDLSLMNQSVSKIHSTRRIISEISGDKEEKVFNFDNAYPHTKRNKRDKFHISRHCSQWTANKQEPGNNAEANKWKHGEDKPTVFANHSFDCD
jgi:hypothetical protein